MIVVATEDFRLYHEAVTTLREREVTFTTIEPAEPLPEGTNVVLSAPDDTVEIDDEVEHVTAEAEAVQPAIEDALSVVRDGAGRTVIGVDPGNHPGIAVMVGETVVSTFHVPLAEAVEVIEREVESHEDPIVRIGDGARLQGAQIVNELDGVTIELVDETGTTPYLGTGTRGMGDVIAAINIARLSGEPVESRTVEPTAGELQRIKAQSRAQSDGDRTISEGLARQVAVGELSIEAALRVHRDGDTAGDGTAADGDSRTANDEWVDGR